MLDWVEEKETESKTNLSGTAQNRAGVEPLTQCILGMTVRIPSLH